MKSRHTTVTGTFLSHPVSTHLHPVPLHPSRQLKTAAGVIAVCDTHTGGVTATLRAISDARVNHATPTAIQDSFAARSIIDTVEEPLVGRRTSVVQAPMQLSKSRADSPSTALMSPLEQLKTFPLDTLSPSRRPRRIPPARPQI